jgi:hypothetical protein
VVGGFTIENEADCPKGTKKALQLLEGVCLREASESGPGVVVPSLRRRPRVQLTHRAGSFHSWQQLSGPEGRRRAGTLEGGDSDRNWGDHVATSHVACFTIAAGGVCVPATMASSRGVCPCPSP